MKKYEKITVNSANEFIEVFDDGYLPQNIKIDDVHNYDLFKLIDRNKEKGLEYMYLYALILSWGKGCKENHFKSFTIFQMLASKGHLLSQINLGLAYERGEGVEKNLEKAVKWYNKAAEQGDLTAQNKLASYYENGQGVEKNLEKAVKWYNKAAEQGDIFSQYNLALMYYKGKGVQKDFHKSSELLIQCKNYSKKLSNVVLDFLCGDKEFKKIYNIMAREI